MELAEALFLKPPKQIQNVTPKRIARLQKQNQFLTLLFRGHITFTEAARQIGISRQQAYRWFRQWKQQEGYEIDREWWQLYNRLLDESPEKAFEGLTRLKYRMTPDKVEVKQDIRELIVKWDMTNESSLNPQDTLPTTRRTTTIPPEQSQK